MTTNEQPVMKPEGAPLPSPPETPAATAAAPAAATQPAAPKEKKIYAKAEKLLLAVALAVAVLYDRIVIDGVFSHDSSWFLKCAGIFWLCYLVLFYAFYWKKLSRSRILWYIAGCSAALCVWPLFFSFDGANESYGVLAWLIIPAVLMAHAQFAAGGYALKDVWKIALSWLCGWFVKPFSGLPAFFGAAGSLFAGESKSSAKKALIGIAVTLPLLCVLVPLLSGADRMFGYYIEQIARGWDIASFAGHIIVVAVAFLLFYSFLWNVGFGKNGISAPKSTVKIDTVICCIVLGAVTLLYVLFCAVQFTYLFAGAGLPDGMTYSGYAREGFAQTVTVCALNLLIFGAFLTFGAKEKPVAVFLAGLLALTGVMLLSGFLRLKLYIDAYGLTWLRVLSAWFVIYLAAVIVLCVVRMVREKVPAIALCALILLGWYVVLGYLNPDAVIERYNQTHNYETTTSAWADYSR